MAAPWESMATTTFTGGPAPTWGTAGPQHSARPDFLADFSPSCIWWTPLPTVPPPWSSGHRLPPRSHSPRSRPCSPDGLTLLGTGSDRWLRAPRPPAPGRPEVSRAIRGLSGHLAPRACFLFTTLPWGGLSGASFLGCRFNMRCEDYPERRKDPQASVKSHPGLCSSSRTLPGSLPFSVGEVSRLVTPDSQA